MAYYDTYNNVQFLDLSGVDEEEKKWILTSLQGISPCVEGPWNKDIEMIGAVQSSQSECTVQTTMNNGIPPALPFEQYPSPPVHVRHVSPIPTQIYPQTYPAPIPIYPPSAFVPQVQYGAPLVPMMPVNASIMSFGGQPVTYATYQQPIQASPIYNVPPVVKGSTAKMNMNALPPHQQQYHVQHHAHDLQQDYCNTGHLPQQHTVLPVQQSHDAVHQQGQPSLHSTHSSNAMVTACNKVQRHFATSVMKHLPQDQQSQQHHVQRQQPSPVANGPVRHASPDATAVATVNKPTTAALQAPNQIPTVVANGHESTHAHVHTNGIAIDAAPSANTDTPIAPSESHTSPSAASDALAPTPAAIPAAVNSAPAPETGGVMSWASLFNKNKVSNAESPECQDVKAANHNLNAKNAKQALNDTKTSSVADDNRKKSLLAEIGDPSYYRMGEVLVSYTPDNKITSLQPRGLINRSNYCYINSILQALLACPPMYNLLHALAQNVTNEHRKHTQIIDSVVRFVNEFNFLPAAQRVGRRSERMQKEQNAVITGRPFEPTGIYKMLSGMRGDSFVVEGRQEDAEEFLGCLLNGLNDEMLELMKLAGAEASASEAVIEDGYKSDSDREWHLIGPKNKGCITRRTEIVRTPISDIFGGHIRSKLHRTGDQITNNIQPFFTLQLNIEKVNTVREALEALVCRNQLEGVTSSKTNEEVEAWQQVTIEELPVVLILHLKCFDFKLDGCTKIVKALEFPVDLKIDTKLLSPKTNYQPKEKQYKLFAIVYHDGKEATKGHYLTDAYHVGYASWLRFDDSSVKAVQEELVLKPHGTRVPYLLFYRRCDTVRNK